MKRNDWILIGIIVGMAALFGMIQFLRPDSTDGMVRITVDGEVYGEYPLADDLDIQINETNHLSIKDGKATMTDATCPDQLCVHQKAVSKDGESIICLPNKVIAIIIDGEESEIDTISN